MKNIKIPIIDLFAGHGGFFERQSNYKDKRNINSKQIALINKLNE